MLVFILLFSFSFVNEVEAHTVRIAFDIFKPNTMLLFFKCCSTRCSLAGGRDMKECIAGLSHNVSLSTCSISNRHARKPLSPCRFYH